MPGAALHLKLVPEHTISSLLYAFSDRCTAGSVHGSLLISNAFRPEILFPCSAQVYIYLHVKSACDLVGRTTMSILMGNISLGSTVCIVLLSLCTFISPTPLETRPSENLSPAPQFEPRGAVITQESPVHVVTRTLLEGPASVVQINPPYYDPECKVGGCTFSYEASGHDATKSASQHL